MDLFFDVLLFPFGERRYFCGQCRATLLRSTQLCEICFRRFDTVRRRGLRIRPHPLLKKIQVWSLWSWHPGADDELSGYITELKGHAAVGAWQRCARAFIEAQATQLSLLMTPLCGFIPVPGHDPDLPDHASLFATALAAELGLPVLYALRRISHAEGARTKNAVKKLNRRERLEQKTQMQVDPKYDHDFLKSKGLWILVDDIMTTGATSRAALEALGLTKAAVWVLALREKGESGGG